MNRDEAREWLSNHGIKPMTAERMLAAAADRGDSGTIEGVFLTYDGQMFNAYEV